MKPFLGGQKILVVGTPTILESDSIDNQIGVVFEDDGRTGYFYARDYSEKEMLFVDAMHLYSVAGVIDREKKSVIRIIWSPDWKMSAILINDMPHGVFDFENKVGYCLDSFPDPDPRTGWKRLSWESSLVKNFYRNDF